MKSALFSVLCEIKERTVLSLRNVFIGGAEVHGDIEVVLNGFKWWLGLVIS